MGVGSGGGGRKKEKGICKCHVISAKLVRLRESHGVAY